MGIFTPNLPIIYPWAFPRDSEGREDLPGKGRSRFAEKLT